MAKTGRTCLRLYVRSVFFVFVALVSRRNSFCWAWVVNYRRPSSHDGFSSVAPSFCPHATTATASTSSSQKGDDKEPSTTTVYRELYPPSTAHTIGTLNVDDTHSLYYEIHGHGTLNALFLHGGPGVGCVPNHARFFDLNKYRVVLLDQRGSGKSTPRGSVVNNTLMHLVGDCERVRTHLNISSWGVVLGGSWGTTLALGYAQIFPKSIQSMILRGICALRPPEVDHLFSASGGAAKRLPDAWREASEAVQVPPDAENGRAALHSYYDMFMSESNSVRLAAAQSWMKWEFTVTASYRNQQATSEWNSTILVSSGKGKNETWHFEDHEGCHIAGGPNKSPAEVVTELRQGIQDQQVTNPSIEVDWSRPRPVGKVACPPVVNMTATRIRANSTGNKTRPGFPPDYIPAMAMLTCYYSVNDKYVLGGYNLVHPQRVELLPKIPCIGIQGALDPICPPDTALTLKSLWPTMELRIPLSSGHSMYDPAILHEILKATDHLAEILTSTPDTAR